MDPAILDLLYDPQTSGGLLMSVPAAQAAALEDQLSAGGAHSWRIGEVIAGAGIEIVA